MNEYRQSAIPKIERRYGFRKAFVQMFGWIPGVRGIFERKKSTLS